jgi:hypothetical protein
MLFILIIAFAAFTRFFGLSWDQGLHLHPDERFLVMVITNLSWPKHALSYLDSEISPLNPHNQGFSFYVYGTWPVILTKFVAELFHRATYDGIPLVGRGLSALADIGTLLLVFLTIRKLTNRDTAAILGMFLYATSVIPIQLAHFFTVDPFETFFDTLVLYFVSTGTLGVPLGIAAGLAISAKISSALILPLIGIAYLAAWPWRSTHGAGKKRWRVVLSALSCGIAAIVAVRLFYPYLFSGWSLNQKVLGNWKELLSYDSPTTMFPPGLQWIGTTPITPVFDLLFVGLGVFQSALTVAAVVMSVAQSVRTKRFSPVIYALLWSAMLFGYESTRFAKPMRYFYSLYPQLAIITAYAWTSIATIPKRRWVSALCIAGLLCWPASYLMIYARPHTRTAASMWIYANVPPDAVIAWEHWDDPLPLPLEHYIPRYTTFQLPVFTPESPKKIEEIANILTKSDIVVLSSNRGYGAMSRASARFPWTNRYYRALFDGKLGFSLAAQFVSRPGIALPSMPICVPVPPFAYGIAAHSLETCTTPGISIVDDYADETFTVYDHPKVLIFKKMRQLPDYASVLVHL